MNIDERFAHGQGESYASPEGLKKVEWSFSDGGRASGMVVEHVFRTPGVQSVTLSVTDKSGESCSAIYDVRVEEE